jgi:hypothetical protein
MNINALNDGVITAKNVREFRKLHPVRIVNRESLFGQNSDLNSKIRAKVTLPSDQNNHFTYGKPTRYSDY